MEKSTTQVLICGAGAAGLTLAIELARRNIPFQLIDKLSHPFQGSRGKGIQPRTQEVFEDMGVLDRLVATGGPYPLQREYRSDGSYRDTPVTEPVDSSVAEPYHMPLMVPQFLTEQILRDRLAELGHSVRYGCELRGFEQDGTGVTARINTNDVAAGQNKELLRVSYLVGTDGGRSFVRQTLNIEFPGKTLGVRAVVADLNLRGLERDVWHCFGGDSMEKMLALCPLAGTALFQLQAPVPLEGEVDLSAHGLEQMIAERSGRSDIRIDSITWSSAYVMNARLADRYRIGRIFLAGDAAHTHPPTGGQGLNTSVQDSYNLGWKLAAVLNGAWVSLLDSYEEERRPIAAQMLGLTTGLLEAAKRGEMRRGREVSQLDLGYNGSSLTFEQPERHGGLLAGDRAPDASLRGAAGQPARLFDLFKGAHWTLLGYEVKHSDVWNCPFAARAAMRIHLIGCKGDLHDMDDNVKNIYGVDNGTWILIRPDGYIGAIISESDSEALEQWMTGIGIGV